LKLSTQLATPAAILSPIVQAALEEARVQLGEMYGGSVAHVILYGLHARREAGPESDVDVIGMLRDDFNLYDELKRLTRLKLSLLDRIVVYLSLQPITEAAYQELRRPLMRNVQSEGIEL